MVYHATPMRGCGPPRVERESESAKQSALVDEEKRESWRRGQKVYVTRTRAS